MPSATEIANLTLLQLGQSSLIENLETGADTVSKRMKRLYDHALRVTQSESDWTWNRRQAALALLRENPDEEFGYAYALPDKCLRARRIVTGGIRESSIDDIVRFRIMSGTGQRELWTNQDNAVLEYSVLVTDTNLFTPEYEEALTYRLAAYAAPSFMQGDRKRKEEVLLEIFRISMMKAKAADAGEEQDQQTPVPSSIRARG